MADSDGTMRSERTPGHLFRTQIDREALGLRERGRSYAAVARRLGMKGAPEAHAAFLRALHSCAAADRREIVAREHGRLDEFEARILEDEGGEPETRERRLTVLAQLRASLA